MATSSSFKQQCPSCEAMVPIKDTSLIGRKIDCPKCKYRFVVEDPDEAEDVEEEKSSKKNAKAKAKSGPRRRPDDEDDDEDRPRKKGSGNSKLIIGVGLAVVAVVVLVVAGVLMMGGSSSTTSGTQGGGTGGGQAMVTPPPSSPTPPAAVPATNTQPEPGDAPAMAEGAAPKKATTPTHGGSQVDVTNLLPGDSEAVANLRVNAFLETTVGRTLFRTPGAALTDMMQRKLGFPADDIDQLVQASSITQNWNFQVLHTAKPFKADAVKAAWALKPAPDSPMQGQEFFLMEPNNNWFDQLSRENPALQAQLKGMAIKPRTEPIAVRIVDDQTIVFADMAPMKQFLAVNGKFPNKSQPPAAAPAEPPPQQASPMGDGPMTLPGKRGGVAGGQAGMQRRGLRPGGEEEPEQKSAVSASYLTINPNLKALLDQIDSTQPVLSLALDFRPLAAKLPMGALASLPGMPKGPPADAIKQGLTEVGLVGASVQMKEGFLVKAGIEFKSENNARRYMDELQKVLPMLAMGLTGALGTKVDVQGDQNADPGAFGEGGAANSPGGYPQVYGQMRGYPGVARPGSGGGLGTGGEAGVSDRPGQGRRPSSVPGGGTSPGAGDNPDSSDRPPSLTSWVRADRDRATLLLTVNVVLDRDQHDKLVAALQPVARKLKAEMEMANTQPRVHDLAEAAKAYATEQKAFPRGTADRALPSTRQGRPYPPDERVSFFAELLPYLNQGDLFRRIDRQKSWRDAENLGAAATLVPAFLDPKNPQSTWFVRYPGMNQEAAATHYVGVGGVGLDAAEYKADDPAVVNKLGVFGYDRSTKLTDITDGASNTMILVEVPPTYKRPWIAGGGSTIQGVPEAQSIKPFVSTQNGNKRGTVVIMADGSVRFLNENTSDEVFKALATIKGGETVGTINQLAPKIQPPEDDQPELKAAPPPISAPSAPKEAAPAKPEAPPPVKPPAEAPKQSSRAAGGNDKALAVLTSQCANCHTGQRSKGKVQIFTQPGVLSPGAPKEKMAEAVASGKMPPKNRPRPSPDDLAALQGWLHATP